MRKQEEVVGAGVESPGAKADTAGWLMMLNLKAFFFFFSLQDDIGT